MLVGELRAGANSGSRSSQVRAPAKLGKSKFTRSWVPLQTRYSAVCWGSSRVSSSIAAWLNLCMCLASMVKTQKNKTIPSSTRLPAIKWNSNNYHFTWLLIAEMEDNRKVLVGAEPGEVCPLYILYLPEHILINIQRITGEQKATFYCATGKKLFPELFEKDARILADRIKAKIDRCVLGIVSHLYLLIA